MWSSISRMRGGGEPGIRQDESRSTYRQIEREARCRQDRRQLRQAATGVCAGPRGWGLRVAGRVIISYRAVSRTKEETETEE